MIALISGGSSLDLPNPEGFPNLTLLNRVTIRRTMDNTLYSYLKTDSNGTLYLINLRFLLWKCYTIELRNSLINFIERKAGEEWTYIDRDGQSWKVRLLTPSVQITDELKYADSTEFQLRGYKI